MFASRQLVHTAAPTLYRNVPNSHHPYECPIAIIA